MQQGSCKATILCIDDDSAGLVLRKTLLEMSGYKVLSAESSETALALFSSEHIDLVISDHLLQGTTGTDIAAQMRVVNPNAKIMILSGLSELEQGTEHVDAFMCKLEPPPVLIAKVRDLLGTAGY